MRCLEVDRDYDVASMKTTTYGLFLLALTAGALGACSNSTGDAGNPSGTSTEQTPTDPGPGGGGGGGENGNGSTSSGGTSSGGTSSGGETKPPEKPLEPAKMKPLATMSDPKVVAALQAGGLDIANLPATLDLAINTSTKRSAVMKAFTIALGVDCTGCHASTGGRVSYGAATPEKKVAIKMWSEFVAKLTKKDGGALFCDNCHQGSKTFVDRAVNPDSVGVWMKPNFVDGLARKDGQTQACASCHGSPFDGSFLDDWEK